MTFDVHQLDTFLLVGAGVTLLAILAVRLSTRVGLPSLLIYLLMGVLLGESVLGIRFGDAALAQALGFAALALILAEGGLTTRWREVQPSLRLGLSLATLGIAVSITVVAVLAHLVLGLSWQLAVLLGAVTSPTDAAAVFSVLRGLPITPRLAGTLESESGLNDAPTVVLVTLISTGSIADHGVAAAAALIVYELIAGAVLGLAIGAAGPGCCAGSPSRRPVSTRSPSSPSPSSRTAPSATIHSSGFAAIYVAALVLGNSDLPHRTATRSFAEGVAWLAQIGLFVMLGLLLTPSGVTWSVVGIALVVSAILLLLARPISVLAVDRRPAAAAPRARLLVVGRAARGGADRAGDHPPGRGRQGLRAPLRHRVRGGGGLDAGHRPDAARGRQAAAGDPPLRAASARPGGGAPRPDGRRHAPGHRQPGVAAARCRGRGAPAATGLVGVDGGARRPGDRPRRRTVLRHGDDLLVVTPRGLRGPTVARLRTVSAHGRLGKWLDE